MSDELMRIKDARIAELEAALKDVYVANYGPAALPMMDNDDDQRWICLGCNRMAWSREALQRINHEPHCLGPRLWTLIGATDD